MEGDVDKGTTPRFAPATPPATLASSAADSCSSSISFCAATSSLRIKLTGELAHKEFTSIAPARVSAAPPGLTCVTIRNSVLEGSPGTGRMKLPARRISLRT